MRLSNAALKEKLSFAMDGVILGMPPRDHTERWNYCKYGTEFMWRKPSESFQPELAGDDAYGKQVPQARAIPLWGGCSAGAFAIVDLHPNKKLHADDCRGTEAFVVKVGLPASCAPCRARPPLPEGRCESCAGTAEDVPGSDPQRRGGGGPLTKGRILYNSPSAAISGGDIP